jgi:cytochrome c biogenesis protein
MVNRKHTARRATPTRRSARYRHAFTHPIHSLWGLFSSVKTALVLIGLLAIIGSIGILIIQAPMEIAASPADFALWVQFEMVGKYGQTWAALFKSLGFFTIFSTWYFKLLLVLLAINIAIGGICKRAPGIWQNFRHPSVRTNDRFYQNALVRTAFATEQDVEGVQRFFRKKHYRVLVKAGNAPGVTYLYAYKNSWATLSTFVFHASLILLMLAPLLTIWQGFGQHSMAERILPSPLFTSLQSLAGFSYPQPLPDGESGIVYPIGTPHNLEYRADQFVARFDPTSGQPTDFYTDLTVFQDGHQVAQHRIRVNDPLTYQGVTFHQASFVLYAWISLTDAQGRVLFQQRPILNQQLTSVNPNTGTGIPVSVTSDLPLPTLQQVMRVAATLTPTGWVVVVQGSDAHGLPTFCGLAREGSHSPLVDLSQSHRSCSQTVAAYQRGDQQALRLTGWELQVHLVKQGTVLLITKDAGAPFIWPISALLIVSLCVTLYFPQRRVWIRYHEGQVQFAGLKEHFSNVQRDLEALARQLAARPVGEHSTAPAQLMSADPPEQTSPVSEHSPQADNHRQ